MIGHAGARRWLRGVRGWWPDRNPLRRRCDRAEAAIVTVLVAVFVAGRDQVVGAGSGAGDEAMAVAEQAALSFAGLLRHLRHEARLTQEELAAVAGLSPRSVSDLERGVHLTAHKDTAGLLADALNVPGAARELFVAAARGRAPAAEVLAARNRAPRGAFAAAATRTLPRDAVGFTGRRAELTRLLEAADGAADGLVSIHAISGMAGIGKTALAVHAAHQLAPSFPDGQFFLPLHAHTPGQAPVAPADALASLLLTAGVAAPQVPPAGGPVAGLRGGQEDPAAAR